MEMKGDRKERGGRWEETEWREEGRKREMGGDSRAEETAVLKVEEEQEDQMNRTGQDCYRRDYSL